MFTTLIATELNQIGFATTVTPSGVIVSLNRTLDRIEIEHAISQIFDEIQFSIERVNKNSYLVRS